MTFNEFWLSLKIPQCLLNTQAQWNAARSLARKAFNAGQRYERKRKCKTK